MMKPIYYTFIILLFAWVAKAQKVSFDPVDWEAGQPVTIKFDFNGTAMSNYSGDLYLWSWVKVGSGESVASPNNGTWAASATAAKLSGTGNVRTITITPTTYFGFSKEHLSVSGINFLVKNVDGTLKTADFDNIKPFQTNGIDPNTDWAADRKIRLWVDVTGTPLAGTSDPLYYWGWYKVGAVDVNAANNAGNWNNSPASALMTRIGTTNSYYIDFVPTDYFATTTANLTPTTIFGLVKKYNGTNGQTANFGFGLTYNKYIIQQINAANVSLSPTLPADNVPVTFTFTAAADLVGETGDVYMHTGVVTDGLSSTTWSHTQGIWGNSTTSPGKMTRSTTNPNQYTLTIPSIRTYYGLATGENAYKIMAVFRNANGSTVENDQGSDYQLEVTPGRYLEMREPVGSFLTKSVGESFRITGYTNELSQITIKVNGTTVQTQSSVNRSTYVYTPPAAGTYTIVIEANNGSSTISKTTSVVVCSTTSIASVAALPAGLKYGINYNATDPTKATLVLHAPTENISSVYVIGDFNNWAVDCNYLMQWDNTKKVFWKELTGLISGKEYVFQYLIDGITRIGDPYTEKVSDPWNDASIPGTTYPNLIAYPAAALPQNGETPTIASVLQTNQTPYTWEVGSFSRIPQNKLNIYQLHFRDFTPEGTFNAAIEKLDYLKRMGINAIETLPVSEFEGNDSWGYNPNFYFAVDKAYGKKDDYKRFVDECHKRGIAVIGDMVLNHAFGTNPHARMYWDDLRNRPAANNPWFNAVSNFANPDAQWGNDFNHESGHTKAFVDSVITYWLKEYKIDGIRFDFTKGFGNTPYTADGSNNGYGCFDKWGGCYDAARIALLKRMATHMWSVSNGATGSQPYVIFEHLATQSENSELGNYGNGIMMWSGVEPNHKYSEIAMGWAPDAADPNKSDVGVAYYKVKEYANPVWVSYMESHDEERLAYKQKQYGNGTIKTDSVVAAKFLRTVAAVNLLFTGPRQVWQFGELGYDYSIDYNGRTGRKPVRWDYFNYPQRKKIYETYARLFWLRNAMPQTFHKDFDNPGATPPTNVFTKSDLVSQFKRYHFYSSVGDTAVTIIANTANSAVTGNPDFNASTATQWFDFITQQWVTVSSSMTLQPGEYRVFMNKKPLAPAAAFTLTDLANATAGNPATNIAINFNEPVVKTALPDFLGNVFNSASLQNAFTLKNAANATVAFTGTIAADNRQIIIDPTTDLAAGTYTLTLLKDSLQNYGGMRIEAAVTFTFTIQQAAYPCVNNKTFVNVTDDFMNQTVNQQTREYIHATNKVSGTARVTYDAKTHVELTPGFEVSNGAVFEAKIGGCN